MERLLSQDLAIGSCKLDGKPIDSMEEGDRRFGSESLIEVESLPLVAALQAIISLRCNQLRKIETECEALVTESLVGEPTSVLETWQKICEGIKSQVGYLPQIGALLLDDQVEKTVVAHLNDLNKIMNSCAQALSAGDVVTFSDTLELMLIPWLRGIHETILGILKRIDNLDEPKSRTK
jgi:hypothetical protein